MDNTPSTIMIVTYVVTHPDFEGQLTKSSDWYLSNEMINLPDDKLLEEIKRQVRIEFSDDNSLVVSDANFDGHSGNYRLAKRAYDLYVNSLGV